MDIGQVMTVVLLMLPLLGLVILCIIKKQKKILLLIGLCLLLIGYNTSRITIFKSSIIGARAGDYQTSDYGITEQDEAELKSILGRMVFKKQNLLSESLSQQDCQGSLDLTFDNHNIGRVFLCLDKGHVHRRPSLMTLLHRDCENIHCSLVIGEEYYYAEEDQDLVAWFNEQVMLYYDDKAGEDLIFWHHSP